MTGTRKPIRLESRNLDVRQQKVAYLIQELASLERETDPNDGAASATGKNYKACMALNAANKLVEQLAGWALHHVCGLSLREERLSLHSSYGDSDEVGNMFAFDSHEHEYSGAELTIDDYEIMSPLQKRMILRNMLYLSRMKVARDAVEAIDGLSYGKADPMIKASKTRRKVGYAGMLLQLRVIAIARFYGEIMGGVKRGLEHVANAMRVDVETLRVWEKRLKRDLGSLAVTESLQGARDAAHVLMAIDDYEARGIQHHFESDTKEFFTKLYGTKTLASLSADYRKNRSF